MFIFKKHPPKTMAILFWNLAFKIRFRIFKKTSSPKSRSSFLKIGFQNCSKIRNQFSDNFSRNFSQNQFWDVLKIAPEKKNHASKTTKNFKRTISGQKAPSRLERCVGSLDPKKYTEKYYNIKHECKLFLNQKGKNSTHPRGFSKIPTPPSTLSLLLEVLWSKSSAGSSREAGRRRSVA